MRGVFCLGGKQVPRVLPTFDDWKGAYASSRYSGKYAYDPEQFELEISMPQRDKQINISANLGSKSFVDGMKSLDTELEGNYKTRIKVLADQLPEGYLVTVNTLGDHGGLTLISNAPLFVWGLLDTQTESAYLLWSSEESSLFSVQEQAPLRYLVYRFAVQERTVMHIHSQVVCGRWYRWTERHSHLFSFNALERRLSHV